MMNPMVAAMATSDGLLPIHFAVTNSNITEQLLQLLKHAYPNGLTSVLLDGDTLLHHALSADTISEIAIQWW
jgi:ankyrin repeat protein